MTIIDDTYTKIIIRATGSMTGQNRFFRHTEHGGPVTNPLYADTYTSTDEYLRKSLQHAIQNFPGSGWEYARLSVAVKPFSSQELVERLIDKDIKRKALEKLSPDEKRVLGIGP